jgi:Uma2 family endonuclease
MATAELTAEKKPSGLDQEQRLILHSIGWDDYQAISKALTGRHVRLAYDRGTLEFMTISPTHGRYNWLIGRLIATLTEELGMPILGFSDMTCDRPDLERGMEPDQCFYLTNEARMRGKQTVDLAVDPPPDLGIEIDITRSSRRRLRVYAALGIPEAWLFDGDKIQVYRLNTEGQYVESERSLYFPLQAIEQLTAFLRRGSQTDENTLIRSFREWVREQIAQGWADR